MNSSTQSDRIGNLDIVVPAAGKGTRMGEQTSKQYLVLAGKPILQHTIETLLELNPRKIVLVVAKEDTAWQQIAVTEKCHVVPGGATRAESVLNGLKAIEASADDWVMVHDGVRPCIRSKEVRHLYDELKLSEIGGLLGIPVVDTLKKTDAGYSVTSTIPRGNYWLAQTPQMFRYGLLCDALFRAIKQGSEITDEASAVEHLGYNPIMVKGRKDNIKITTREDLILAGMYLQQSGI